MSWQPTEEQNYRAQNRQELLADLLRNAKGMPAVIGGGLASLPFMSGSGLGVMAGALRNKLRGDPNDLGAAVETAEDFPSRVAQDVTELIPGSEESKAEAARGLTTVTDPLERGMRWTGEKAGQGAKAFGASPEVQAGISSATYTAANMVDPEMLLPVKATAMALRGGQQAARRAAETAVPMAEALRNVPKGQRGAYTQEDLSAVEGDYTQRSTIDLALESIAKSPKEQKAKGRQFFSTTMEPVVEKGKPLLNPDGTPMMRPRYSGTLLKHGASPEEIKWSGLGALLEQDFPVTLDDLIEHQKEFGVQHDVERLGHNPFIGDQTQTPEAVELKAQEAIKDTNRGWYNSLTFPAHVKKGDQIMATFPSYAEANNQRYQMMADAFKARKQELKDNPHAFMTDAQKARITTPEQIENWADDKAYDDAYYGWDVEVDTTQPATNYDAILQDVKDDINNNPWDYFPHLTKPKRAEYNRDPSWTQRDVEGRLHDYGEQVHVLKREGRYGRGIDVTPEMEAAAVTPMKKAQLEALRQRRADPVLKKARQNIPPHHWHAIPNQTISVRTSTIKEPPEGGVTPGTMHFGMEVQSDAAQQGRKRGIFSEEEVRAKAEAARQQEMPKLLEFSQRLDDMINTYPASEVSYAANSLGYGSTQELLQRLNELRNGADNTEIWRDTMQQAARQLYYSSGNPNNEAAATALGNEIRDFRDLLQGEGNSNVLPPAPMIEDTKKVMQLGLQQHIADAVAAGHQYVGFSPGYEHAPNRWGSEGSVWWRDPNDPKKVVIAAGQLETGGTRGEKFRSQARALRRDPQGARIYGGPAKTEIDLTAPDVLDQLGNFVGNYFPYDIGQWPDKKARTKALAQKMYDRMMKEAEGEMSPRAEGMVEAYDKLQISILEKILKQYGSKAKIIKGEANTGKPMGMRLDDATGSWEPVQLSTRADIADFKAKAAAEPDKFEYRPAITYWIDIDPALAQAAKKGFKKPF